MTSLSSHLLSLASITRDQYFSLFRLAHSYEENQGPLLPGKTLITFFLEPSTRTQLSFELAAQRLGMHCLRFAPHTSSLTKEESYEDTLLTLGAMGIDVLAIRHSQEGALQQAAHILPTKHIINAGEGCSEHPSQALLDCYTLYRHQKDFSQLKIAIIGDILHSRVARSQLYAFKALGVSEIRAIGPHAWLPSYLADQQVALYPSLQEGLQGVDVICLLRVQKERIPKEALPNLEDYYQQYGLKPEHLRFAHPNAVILHPGPVNRQVEISEELMKSSKSLILEQVKNGVFLRMAVISSLCRQVIIGR